MSTVDRNKLIRRCLGDNAKPSGKRWRILDACLEACTCGGVCYAPFRTLLVGIYTDDAEPEAPGHWSKAEKDLRKVVETIEEAEEEASKTSEQNTGQRTRLRFPILAATEQRVGVEQWVIFVDSGSSVYLPLKHVYDHLHRASASGYHYTHRNHDLFEIYFLVHQGYQRSPVVPKEVIRSRATVLGKSDAIDRKTHADEWRAIPPVSVTPELKIGPFTAYDHLQRLSTEHDVMSDAIRDAICVGAPPSALATLLGRDNLLASVIGELSAYSQGDADTERSSFLALAGMGGIGKTAIAAALFHDPSLRECFPDGTFWISFGNRLKEQREIVDCVAPFIEKISGKHIHIGSILDLREQARATFENKRLLIVADDIWHPDQLEWLLEAASGSCIIATSRDVDLLRHLSPDLQIREVPLLSSEDARHLIALHVGEIAEEYEDAVDTIIGECAGIPLALHIACAKAQAEDLRHVAELLLSVDMTTVNAYVAEYYSMSDIKFEDGRVDMYKVIHASMKGLQDSKREKKAFLKLAILPEKAQVPFKAMETIWGMPGVVVSDVARTLEGRFLVILNQDTLSLHDMLRDYLVCRARKKNTLQKLHAEVRSAYAVICRKNTGDTSITGPIPWHEGTNDGYFYERVTYHLNALEEHDELRNMLLSFPWLERKLELLGIAAVLEDLQHTCVRSSFEVQHVGTVLRAASRHLACAPHQLAPQILARTPKEMSAALDALLRQARTKLSAALCPSGPPLRKWPPAFSIFGLRSPSPLVPVLAMASDGTSLISVDCNGVLRIMDTLLGSLQIVGEDVCDVCALALSPNDLFVAAGNRRGEIKVFSLTKKRLIQSLKSVPSAEVTALAINNGGDVLAGLSDGSACMWQSTQEHPDWSTIHREGPVTAVAFWDGLLLTTGCDFWHVYVWNPKSGQLARQISLPRNSILSYVSLANDGKRVLTKDRLPFLYSLSLDSGKLTVAEMQSLSVLVASSDGACAIWQSIHDSYLSYWRIGESYGTVALQHPAWTAAVLSADGSVGAAILGDRDIEVFSVPKGRMDTVQQPGEMPWPVTAVACSGSAKLAAAALLDGTIHVWNVDSGVLAYQVPQMAKEPVEIRFTDSDENLLVLTTYGHLRAVQLTSGAEEQLCTGSSPIFPVMTLATDGSHVAVGDRHTGTITVMGWDSVESVSQSRLMESGGPISAVALSDKGERLIVSMKNGPILRIQTDTGMINTFLDEPTDEILALSVSGSGEYVIGGSYGGVLAVWKAATGERLWSVKAHTSRIHRTAISPDSHVLATVSEDQSARLWRRGSGEMLAEFRWDACLTACILTSTHLLVGDGVGSLLVFEYRS